LRSQRVLYLISNGPAQDSPSKVFVEPICLVVDPPGEFRVYIKVGEKACYAFAEPIEELIHMDGDVRLFLLRATVDIRIELLNRAIAPSVAELASLAPLGVIRIWRKRVQ